MSSVRVGVWGQGDLDELGLDVGPRVAIANYLQTAKNKFKGTTFLFTVTHNTQHTTHTRLYCG